MSGTGEVWICHTEWGLCARMCMYVCKRMECVWMYPSVLAHVGLSVQGRWSVCWYRIPCVLVICAGCVCACVCVHEGPSRMHQWLFLPQVASADPTPSSDDAFARDLKNMRSFFFSFFPFHPPRDPFFLTLKKYRLVSTVVFADPDVLGTTFDIS